MDDLYLITLSGEFVNLIVWKKYEFDCLPWIVMWVGHSLFVYAGRRVCSREN